MTNAGQRATIAHRQKRRRVELLMVPNSDEARALDELAELLGSQSAALRYAILNVQLPGY